MVLAYYWESGRGSQFMREHFDRKGWYKQDQVLNASEVAKLRKDILDIMKNEYGDYVRIFTTDRLIKHNELLRQLVNTKIVNCLKQILGDNYTLVGDMSVQLNSYGSISGHGWHIDAGSEELINEDLNDPNYRFVKCGIYLQDNSEEFGGGIQIKQGFHKLYQMDLFGINKKLKFKIPRIVRRLLRNHYIHTPAIKSGDFLTFHSCLPHRSAPFNKTSHRNEVRDNFLPIEYTGEDNAKIVIYFNATTNKFVKNHFISNLYRVIDEITNHSNRYTFYNHFKLNKSDFHPEFLKSLVANDIDLAIFKTLVKI